MRPAAPSKLIWILGLIVGILGILVHFIHVEDLSAYDFWLLLAGFTLLAVGTSYRKSWF